VKGKRDFKVMMLMQFLKG